MSQNYEDIKKQLHATFGHHKKDIELCENITYFLEVNCGTNYTYNIQFQRDGICINNFDKIPSGAITSSKCFDILTMNSCDIKYIELKSSIDDKVLKKIGDQFIQGHIKALQFLCFSSTNSTNPIKFIVIYTKDTFIKQKITQIKDPTVKRKLTKVKDYIKAWNNDCLIVSNKNYPHCNLLNPAGFLPITKIKYDTSTNTPIDLDSY